MLRELEFHESLEIQIRLCAYEGFRRGVTGPAGRDGELTGLQDELLWETSGRMLRDYRKGRLSEPALVKLVLACQGGRAGIAACKSLLRNDAWLMSDWFSGLAYVLGCHYAGNLGDREFALELLGRALAAAPAGSDLRRNVEGEIAGLGARR